MLGVERRKPFRMALWMKRKLIIGKYFVALTVMTCIGIIIIIAANQDAKLSKNWTIDFVKTLLQDLLLSPLLFLWLQYYMLKIMRSKALQKKPRLRTLLSLLSDENIFEVLVILIEILVIL